MFKTRIQQLFAIFLILGFICLAQSSLIAAGFSDPACKPLVDALNKLDTQNYHLYITQDGETGKKNMESIYLGDQIYVMFNGKWTTGRTTRKQMVDMKKKAENNEKESSCKYLHDDTVNGEAAAVFSTHEVSEAGAVDSQVWVSKSKGLILKQDIDIDVGGGAKSRMSNRFDYANVQAPKM